MPPKIIRIWNQYRTWIVSGLVAMVAFSVGTWLGDSSSPPPAHDHESEAATIWTCSMHPQIRQPESGQCPICGMDLIPISDNANDGSGNETIVTLSSAHASRPEFARRRCSVWMQLPPSDIFWEGSITTKPHFEL